MEGTRLCFDIAGVNIALEGDRPFRVTGAFIPFLTDKAARFTARFTQTDCLPLPAGEPVYRGDCFTVYGFCPQERLFFTGQAGDGSDYAYGLYHPDSRQADIRYTDAGACHLNETGNAFFHIGWESMLLRERRLILHACAVGTEFGSLLFSGVAGIGKSTQGDLWRRYEGASPINGDRPILYRGEKGWLACGSPYAGSSRWYEAVQAPIRAIVLLQQAKENAIRRLSAAEAFRRLYAMLVVCDWDSSFTLQTCDLTEQLASEVPVYELACTPTRDAVNTLKEVLRHGDQ